jgi:hypothetical protein
MADLSLTAEQRRILHRLLMAAFPQASALERMVYFGLGENLAVIADRGSLSDVTFALMRWAEANDRLADLIRAAVDENPTNTALRAFAVEVGVLAAPPAPAAPTAAEPRKRPPRLTPFEKVERFREAREAVAARRWDRAEERLSRIRDYPGARELLFEARMGAGRQYERLAAFRRAYRQDEWTEVIRIARQLDPDEPPEVAPIVARAWREVPVEERVLSGHTDAVSAVAMTPDGRHVLSGAWDQTLRLWDLTAGQPTRALAGHRGPVSTVAVTPDGRQALSGSWDKTLRLWDLAAGQNVGTLTGHTDYIRAVAVTPDGRQAISGSADGTLRLWDLASGRELRTLTGHKDWVNAVAVSAEGRTVVSGGADGTVRVWTWPAGMLG